MHLIVILTKYAANYRTSFTQFCKFVSLPNKIWLRGADTNDQTQEATDFNKTGLQFGVYYLCSPATTVISTLRYSLIQPIY